MDTLKGSRIARLPCSSQHFSCHRKASITSLLKFAYTALSLAGLFNLWRWGGAFVRSAKVFVISSSVRDSRKTLEWKEPLGDLRRASLAEVPSLSLIRQWFKVPWCAHWDTTAICEFLHQASFSTLETESSRMTLGTSLVKGCCFAYASVILQALENTEVEQNELALSFHARRFKFQRALASHLLSILFPDDMASTIFKRVRKYHPEIALLFHSSCLLKCRCFLVCCQCVWRNVSFELV